MLRVLEYLNELDGQLLLLINNHNSAFTDNFFYSYSGKWVWVALYAALIAYCIIRWRSKGLWVVLALIVSVVLADQISSHLIKPLVCRLRPTHDLSLSQYVHLVNGYRGGLYGFVSSHAANSFAIALLIHLIAREKTVSATMFIWACINVYSRMYLGVHYPGDIICGTIIGLLVAVATYLPIRSRIVQLADYKPNLNTLLKLIVPCSFVLTLIGIIIGSIIALQ